MKAILMAGGSGTRLGLLTNHNVNKHMLAVYDRPMIVYVIETLVKGGVTDIRISLNGPNPQLLMALLEDGAKFGCEIHYVYHEKTFLGPVRHFIHYRKWAASDDVLVMLGDSFFRHVLDFTAAKAPHIWTMPLIGIDDPSKYGQVLVEGKRVLKLVEKPKQVFSKTIATGCWLFPGDVFAVAERLASKEGELQFGDLALDYVNAGRMTHTSIPAGSYLDLGTPEALLIAANIVASERQVLSRAAE